MSTAEQGELALLADEMESADGDAAYSAITLAILDGKLDTYLREINQHIVDRIQVVRMKGAVQNKTSIRVGDTVVLKELRTQYLNSLVCKVVAMPPGIKIHVEIPFNIGKYKKGTVLHIPAGCMDKKEI